MIKLLRRIKFIFKFWKSIPFIVDFFIAKEVDLYKKVLSGLMFLTYAFIPFDLIPDFIYLFGIVDDIVVTGFIIERMVKWAPETLKNKYRLI